MVLSPQMRHTIFFMGRKQWQTCPSSAPPPFNIAVLPFLAFSRRIVRLDSGGGMQDLEEGGGAKGLLSGCPISISRPPFTPVPASPPSLLTESMSFILAAVNPSIWGVIQFSNRVLVLSNLTVTRE